MNHTNSLYNSLQTPGSVAMKVEWGNVCCVVLKVLYVPDLVLFTLGTLENSGDKTIF